RPGRSGSDASHPARPSLGHGMRDRSVRTALRHLSTELSSAQVGITLTTILLGYTAQPALNSLLSTAFGGTSVPTAVSSGLAGALALVLVNAFSMVCGELIPKNFALSAPLATARLVVPVQRVFTVTFKPLIAVLNGSANALLRRLGVEPREELSGARSASELASLVRRSAARGAGRGRGPPGRGGRARGARGPAAAHPDRARPPQCAGRRAGPAAHVRQRARRHGRRRRRARPPHGPLPVPRDRRGQGRR